MAKPPPPPTHTRTHTHVSPMPSSCALTTTHCRTVRCEHPPPRWHMLPGADPTGGRALSRSNGWRAVNPRDGPNLKGLDTHFSLSDVRGTQAGNTTKWRQRVSHGHQGQGLPGLVVTCAMGASPSRPLCAPESRIHSCVGGWERCRPPKRLKNALGLRRLNLRWAWVGKATSLSTNLALSPCLSRYFTPDPTYTLQNCRIKAAKDTACASSFPLMTLGSCETICRQIYHCLVTDRHVPAHLLWQGQTWHFMRVQEAQKKIIEKPPTVPGTCLANFSAARKIWRSQKR